MKLATHLNPVPRFMVMNLHSPIRFHCVVLNSAQGYMYLHLFDFYCKVIQLRTKSKSCYDWRSVSQYVLVSSPLWNLRPDIIFCLKVAVLSLWGALSDERSSLSPVSHCQQYLVHCQKCNIIYLVHITCFMYMQYILDLCQHRLSTADHATTSVAYTTTAV
jgi:hypothetical protein